MTSNRKAWAVMLAAYVAGIAIPLNQSKVPPVMQVLMRIAAGNGTVRPSCARSAQCYSLNQLFDSPVQFCHDFQRANWV